MENTGFTFHMCIRSRGQVIGCIHVSVQKCSTGPHSRVTFSLFCAEREENVKTDIFTAYRALLSVTQSQSVIQSGDADGMEVTDRCVSVLVAMPPPPPAFSHTPFPVCSPIALLGTQVEAIVKALHKQLRDKSVKTRQGCFSLLTSLITVLPGALGSHVGALVPGILYCLK